MSLEHVPSSLQRRVRDRAANRCEYCRLAQTRQEATFHVDHVEPRRAGGATAFENLALACVSCSLRKGARTTGTDPVAGRTVTIFDPRRQSWDEHFAISPDATIIGKTATGRATVDLLKMNRALGVAIRHEERLRGRLP